MDEAPLDVVLRRLEDKPLAENAVALLLAALRGDALLLDTDGLDDLLGGQAPGRPAGERPGRSGQLEKRKPDTERARALTSGNTDAPEDGTIGVLRGTSLTWRSGLGAPVPLNSGVGLPILVGMSTSRRFHIWKTIRQRVKISRDESRWVQGTFQVKEVHPVRFGLESSGYQLVGKVSAPGLPPTRVSHIEGTVRPWTWCGT